MLNLFNLVFGNILLETVFFELKFKKHVASIQNAKIVTCMQIQEVIGYYFSLLLNTEKEYCL